MYTLLIKINTEDKNEYEYLKNYYENFKLNNEDSGVDLVIPNNYIYLKDRQIKVNHKINVCLLKKDKPCAYYLYPRSSISKTNFRLANSVGIIDKGYRGDIIAKLDIVSSFYLENKIEKGNKLTQICTPDLEPINYIKIVDYLPDSLRKKMDLVQPIKKRKNYLNFIKEFYKI